ILADEAVKAIVEGAFVGNFDPDTYKSDRKDQTTDALTVVARSDQSTLQKAVDEARILGESQNFTRQLVNEPGNRMTPTILADHARKMSQEVGLKCEVYGAEKLKELKMGAFWGVAQGSDEPPALIVMRYEPAGAPDKPVLGRVGKGVTFDTGGISIKPADGMEKMKYDMAGGATMIGAMRAIALLKPNIKVTAIVCATENMPSGTAQKAGGKMWGPPLDEEYKESIRSNRADIVNSGGRWGGAITAAMFLKEFAEDTPWIHLDIAGTAWTEDNKAWIAKGPSGIAVRSLVEFARDFGERF